MASQETFNDLGSSSSEDDGSRADLTERSGEEKSSPVAVRRHHPFSVEALMSGRKTDSRHGEGKGRPVAAVCPAGLGSLYLCRETCSPPGGSGQMGMSAPSSPVKSEASESEECAPWVTSSAFSTQPRKFLSHTKHGTDY